MRLRLLHLVALLSGLRFGLGIWVLFYLCLTDYAGIGLAETVTIVTSFAMEVPTGIAADRWGRKPCLVGAFALELAGYFLLAAAGGLSGLLVSLGCCSSASRSSPGPSRRCSGNRSTKTIETASMSASSVGSTARS